jgi:hypothetical protein
MGANIDINDKYFKNPLDIGIFELLQKAFDDKVKDTILMYNHIDDYKISIED